MLGLAEPSGMRVSEGLRLRVKDIDFGNRYIVVRQGKGGKDRRVPLPGRLEAVLEVRVADLKRLYEADRAKGVPGVYLPKALSRKLPKASISFGWQWFWPMKGLSVDPETGVTRRHHVDPRLFQRALRGATVKAGLM